LEKIHRIEIDKEFCEILEIERKRHETHNRELRALGRGQNDSGCQSPAPNPLLCTSPVYIFP
jgi:hypothetical protein